MQREGMHAGVHERDLARARALPTTRADAGQAGGAHAAGGAARRQVGAGERLWLPSAERCAAGVSGTCCAATMLVWQMMTAR